MKDISKDVKVERITPENQVCFFGYYDMSPENQTGTKILYNIAPFGDHMPSKKDELQVGYYSEIDKEFKLIGKTTAWNFQEGCRLQWLTNSECIYNVRTDSGYGSILYNTEVDKVVCAYPFPVYSIKNGKNLSYNFNRSRYSYAHDSREEETNYETDGIFLGNLEDGKNSLLISLSRLSKDSHTESFTNWVEHCSFNPDGDYFCFFHRWNDQNGSMHTRFCVSDLHGDYKVLLDEGFCSHFGWRNRDILTAWGRLPSKINAIQGNTLLRNTGAYRLLVKIYHTLVKKDTLRQKISNDSYIYFNISDCEKCKLECSDFVADGHCTWSKNERFMLTDTYPDSQNFRSLMIYDSQDNNVYLLGKFFSYPDIRDKEKYAIAGIRCDLHPKWAYSEKNVYFDSTHEGFRGLYRVNIEKDFRVE